MAKEQDAVTFHYVKSADCRELKVSGVFGGMNRGSGELHMAVFVERPPIPLSLDYFIGPDGSLKNEVPGSRAGKEGLVRVVQSVLHMDLPTALALQGWLNNHIESFLKDNPNIVVEKNKP